MAEQQLRDGLEIPFEIADGQTETDSLNIEGGCFGTLIVPAGSSLIGKTLQFVAVSQHTPARFAATELFSTPITLAAGANPLSSDQIREAGACSRVKLRVNTAVTGDSPFVLLWKS